MDELYQIIDGMRDELVEMLSRWLRVPSVRAQAEGDAPFGEANKRMLLCALRDCERLGLTVRNFDNYVGDARMGPLGVEPLGILAHTDVVPAGDGWDTDPFEPTIVGDRIFARGTSDDKGPAVAALLAMAAILRAGVPLRREVRLILGCDEECGWEDIDHYVAHCDMPRTGFSPDATYPVINTEKGLLHLSLRAPAAPDGLCVRDIHVGERPNVVPGRASALVAGDAALCERVNTLARDMHLHVSAAPEGDAVRIESEGVPGHAAFPEVSRNAIGQLLLMLRALGVTGGLRALADKVGMEYDGAALGVSCTDRTSGPLTCNLGILRYSAAEGLYATLDIRFPLLVSSEAVVRTIGDALAPDVALTVDTVKQPHHVAPNSELVTALLDAYHAETGLARECIAIGGGTYARSLEEGVAFGCTFPGEPDVAHQANESVSLDELMKNVRIFAHAIVRLAGA